MEKTKNRVKLCRLRDIVLYHLQKANKNVTMGDLDALEDDIKVWVKNFIMTLEKLDVCPRVSFIGEENAYEEN